MRVSRSIAALVILLSSTAQAGAINSPEICQKMVLSLLENFNPYQSESREMVIQFADECMPESVLSGHPEGFKAMQLKKANRKIANSQARI